MKKTVIFFLFISTLFLFINGCSTTEDKSVTISVGGAPTEIQFLQKILWDFEKKKGIKVNLVRQPTDTDQRRQGLVIPLKAKKSNPDVFLMDVAWIAQFAASDWLANLNELDKKNPHKLSAFFRKVVDLADKYDGKLIALPLYVDAGLLYYRKDLLKKYGYNNPPQTWDELIEISAKIQKDMKQKNPGFFAFVWQGAQYEGLICNFIEFAASSPGGGLIREDNNILVNSPQNMKAVHLMYDLIQQYEISPPNTFTEMKEEEVRTFFQQGNAVFERNWPYAWALHQAKDSKVRGKVGMAPLPHFPGGKSVATLGGWHIGISKFSNVKEDAWELVKYLTSYKVQKELALNLGWNPGRKDVYSDKEVLQKIPHFKNLRTVFVNAIPRPNVPYYTQVSEILQKSINSALAGTESVKSALDQAQEEVKNIVERYED